MDIIIANEIITWIARSAPKKSADVNPEPSSAMLSMVAYAVTSGE